MQAFLNELSLPLFDHSTKAKALIDSLGSIYKISRGHGVRQIKIQASFFQHKFADDYTFNTWISAGDTDHDLRTLLLDVLTSTPFVDDIFKNYEIQHKKPLEMYVQGMQCFGLGLASDKIYDTIAFSYSGEKWNASLYDIEIRSIDEDANGNLVDEVLSAVCRNVATEAHVVTHTPFIQKSVKGTIRGGRELWIRRSSLFNNLDFCDSVEEQLRGMDESMPEFQQILNRLFELQNFSTNWDGSAIKPADFHSKVTPESQSRLDKFKDKLTIKCPDGKYRLFSWHARYTPGAGRIHFEPLKGDKKVLIGSIASQNEIK